MRGPILPDGQIALGHMGSHAGRSTGLGNGGLALFSAERAMPLIVGSGPQRSSSQGRAFYARRVSGCDP